MIASIVFLGLEMQQNTGMKQLQTVNSIVENQFSFYERAIDSIDFARVATEFIENGYAYAAGTAEGLQYSLFLLSKLWIWKNEFYRYQIGLFYPDEFEARISTWRRQITPEKLAETWGRTQDSFAPNFRFYMNGIIDEIS